jgi:hypothetical protein
MSAFVKIDISKATLDALDFQRGKRKGQYKTVP